MGLIGLQLAFERIDEPAVEGVDLYLGGRVNFQDIETDLCRIADPVTFGLTKGWTESLAINWLMPGMQCR